jgi:hypothetical protein
MAMLCNRPVSDLMEEGIDREYHQSDASLTLAEMFDALSIDYLSFNTCDRNSLGEKGAGAYLVCVPSLNIMGGNHQLIVEMDDEGDWVVLDPNEGKDGKIYYTSFPTTNPLQFMLGGGYTVEAFIPRRNLELVYLPQEVE